MSAIVPPDAEAKREARALIRREIVTRYQAELARASILRRVRIWLAIERIDDASGEHYLPPRGRIPQSKLRCRATTGKVFSLLVPGVYAESAYGAVGDTVAFFGRPGLLSDDLVHFDELRQYAVMDRNRANKAPEPTPGSVTPRAIEGASK